MAASVRICNWCVVLNNVNSYNYCCLFGGFVIKYNFFHCFFYPILKRSRCVTVLIYLDFSYLAGNMSTLKFDIGMLGGRMCILRAYICICMHVWMYVCMYVYLYVNLYYMYMYKHMYTYVCGDRGSTVVKVLCYNSEGRWFDPSWCQWILSLT